MLLQIFIRAHIQPGIEVRSSCHWLINDLPRLWQKKFLSDLSLPQMAKEIFRVSFLILFFLLIFVTHQKISNTDLIF
jgi:hypothetical protein